MTPTPQSPGAYRHPVHEGDLTAVARIRNAALECFAAAGLANASIRDVAKAAGTSPGLVQHHFKTKAGLLDAVNEYVTSIVVDAFGDPADDTRSEDPIQAAGDHITAFVAANPTALRYIGRAIVEGDPAARQVFGAFVDVISAAMERLAKNGSLHDDLDLEWAAMHLVIFNLATLLFEEAIDAKLPAPFFDPQQLRRWNVATTELYRRGMFSSRRSRRPASDTTARRSP
jgi:AcrR family transcriptional regulator